MAGFSAPVAFVRRLVSSPLDIAITLACLAAIGWIAPPLLRWGIIDAVWTGGPDRCAAAAGACWAFIAAKFEMSLFGLYPFDQRWRPGTVLVLFAVTVLVSAQPRFWRRELLLTWALVVPAMWMLMAGGLFGLRPVETREWGGLTVTIFISVFGLVAGYPLGILLALGRRSSTRELRWLSVGIIELVRGVPLVSLIFMSAVMLPLFLPNGVELDRLARVQFAFTIFAAAYLAEVFRGGLQSVPKGQDEAAKSLGLGYWARVRLVVLPQALQKTIPAQVNTFIVIFKDTTLVIIIGVFDLFTTLRAALGDPEWQGFAIEAYVYAALIYFCLCFAMSRYSLFLERRVTRGYAR